MVDSVYCSGAKPSDPGMEPGVHQDSVLVAVPLATRLGGGPQEPATSLHMPCLCGRCSKSCGGPEEAAVKSGVREASWRRFGQAGQKALEAEIASGKE